MRHFCTLFDSGYLTRAVALHQSLRRHAGEFVMHALVLDEEAREILRKMSLPGLRVYALEEAEDSELLRVKPSRSRAEYCWTLTPSLPLFVMARNPEADVVSYIDADCWFFSSPEPMFEEMGEAPALIVEHRFSAEYRAFEKEAGRFNVGFLAFRASPRGREILQWWRERCLEWCYARYEDGKYGDQLYLDRMAELFPDVRSLRHPGGGLGPWNIWGTRLSEARGRVLVDGEPAIFHHYHGFKAFRSGQGFAPSTNGYRFSQRQLDLVYSPYRRALDEAMREIRRAAPDFAKGEHDPEAVPEALRPLRRRARLALSWARSLR